MVQVMLPSLVKTTSPGNTPPDDWFDVVNESANEPLEHAELLPDAAVEEGVGTLVLVGEVVDDAGTEEEVVVVAREVGLVAFTPDVPA
jgi:hypothetical protein